MLSAVSYVYAEKFKKNTTACVTTIVFPLHTRMRRVNATCQGGVSDALLNATMQNV